MNETVQDGVGIGRIADDFVPTVYWKLGGNHRGTASVAFLEDFQEIVPGGGVERLQAPVIENEQIGAAQVAQKTRMASVATRQGEGLEEPRHALIEDRAVVATRLVAERRGQPALADAGWADERQIVVGVDPWNVRLLRMRPMMFLCSLLPSNSTSCAKDFLVNLPLASTAFFSSGSFSTSLTIFKPS